MKTLFTNIKELLQVRLEPITWVAGANMKTLPSIQNAFLLIENDLIADFGTMENCPNTAIDKRIDATGKMILPAWCDSHTHIVFAGNREGEFADRISGLSYEEIANRGGGILNSAKKLNETSEESLFEQSATRLEEVMKLGTGAIEIKSGYGLSVEGELKMLRVIKKLKEAYPIDIKATFLGAHAIPADFKEDKQGYLQLLSEKIMPIIAQEKLAEYVDIFCEKGYFSLEDTELILAAGKRHGLIPKIHVNQFTVMGGVAIAVKHQALTVDHLEELEEADIQALKGSSTMPVALPGCSYFLGIPYTPARRLIDAGLPLALATDYNPGSSPSGNMNFVVSAACIKMNMTPAEAINAATLNAAYAMGLEKELGSITIGKKANLLLTKVISSYAFIPYSFGANQIEKVYIKGEEI
jgi:imidazolonepropionase